MKFACTIKGPLIYLESLMDGPGPTETVVDISFKGNHLTIGVSESSASSPFNNTLGSQIPSADSFLGFLLMRLDSLSRIPFLDYVVWRRRAGLWTIVQAELWR
jgi:hypothetical protein